MEILLVVAGNWRLVTGFLFFDKIVYPHNIQALFYFTEAKVEFIPIFILILSPGDFRQCD